MRARLSEALDQICLAEGVTRDKLVSVDIISATRSASGMSGPRGSAEPAPIRAPLCCPGAWKDLLGPVPLSERPSLVVNTVEDRLVDRSRSKDPSRPCHKPQASGSLGVVTQDNCRRRAAIVNQSLKVSLPSKS